MKRIYFYAFSAVFVLLSVVEGSAQVQIHLGATTAVNATFVLDKGLSEDPRYNSKMTYNTAPIGFNFGIDFTNKFGLSLESIQSFQGQVYEIIDIANQIKGERKIDLTYIQVPLLLRFMSGGNGGARANFNIGPQLSFLTQGVESVQTDQGIYEMPEGLDIEAVQQDFPTATQNSEQLANGTYAIPAGMQTNDIFTKKANDFKNTEFQIAAAFGLDIDIARHLYLTTQIRANYSLTDMRNEDVIELIKSGNAGDIFGQRANLLVGIQLGLHYTFGVTRSFKFKN